tara:strand:- start:280 stop:717 length:438 start_codon:yes stop_codon:yes gene_type:complete
MHLLLIILSLFFWSCVDFSPFGDDDCDCSNNNNINCYLQIEAPDLNLLSDGHYQMIINPDYTNNYTSLRAYVGYELEYVGWTSDTYNSVLDVPIVSGAGYTNEEGYSVIGVSFNSEHIGITTKVYAGYYDDCGKQWLDSIYIRVE